MTSNIYIFVMVITFEYRLLILKYYWNLQPGINNTLADDAAERQSQVLGDMKYTYLNIYPLFCGLLRQL